MNFTGDELILALVSLVRATRPGMLRQEADGFTVDFEAIARSKEPGQADRLLVKMGAAMQNDGSAETAKRVSLELDASEARQIAEALEKLEALQAWPKDVMEMSRAMRMRLSASRAHRDSLEAPFETQGKRDKSGQGSR